MSEQQDVAGAEAVTETKNETKTETGAGVAETGAVTDAPARPEQEQEQVAAGPARKPNRKVVKLVAAAVGVVVLAGAGIGAAAALADADRTSPTRYWMAEDHTTGGTQAPVPSVPPNALTGKLLPLPDRYWPGPDIDKEGNDYFLSGERALESFKEARTGLSGSERGERDKALADLKVKGLAGRSYSRRDGDGNAAAEIELLQADPAQLAQFAEFTGKLFALLGKGAEAPKVDGYPQAKCVVAPIEIEKEGKKKEKIDALDCLAVEGDVMVSFRMYGTEGFAAKDAVGLFKQQLDHLKSPGESA
ncbi:hypothetical protein [Streptomyces venezuelae]|uniref:hypothetical protein n=1 Tax=Streptomyces venezuelae TaxID=54571 RepID=UPI003324D968